MTCAFFGHKESPDSIKPLLEKEIRRLIENEGYEEFLVGNQGRFDAMVYSTLKRLQSEYPAIRFYVVLAYLKVLVSVFDFGIEVVVPKESNVEKMKFDLQRYLQESQDRDFIMAQKA